MVSIPHRRAKNWTKNKFKKVLIEVSIPHRRAKNKADYTPGKKGGT